AIKLVESITEIAEATVQTLLEIGVSREDADEVVAIIQKHFREHAEIKRLHKFDVLEHTEGDMGEEDIIIERILAELNMTMEQLEKMVIIIQTAYRKFKERQEREKQWLFGMVDWRIAARSAIALYRKTGVTYYEANRAASLIKAAYKGYYTRRVMKRLLQQGIADDSIMYDEISWELEENKELDYSTASSRITTLELEYQSDETLATEAMYDTLPISPYTDQTQPGEDTLPMDVEHYVYNVDEDHTLYMEEGHGDEHHEMQEHHEMEEHHDKVEHEEQEIHHEDYEEVQQEDEAEINEAEEQPQDIAPMNPEEMAGEE
ncbi:PREDICTED: uncharacterized protein LOC108564754, partial [Nicrophorus vespilloides]